jgi:hypothetical protein
MGDRSIVVIRADAGAVSQALGLVGLASELDVRVFPDAPSASGAIFDGSTSVAAVVIALGLTDDGSLQLLYDLHHRAPSVRTVVIAAPAAAVVASELHPGAFLVRDPAFAPTLAQAFAMPWDPPPRRHISGTRLRAASSIPPAAARTQQKKR